MASVLPIAVIVLILSFTAAPIPTETLLAFLVGRGDGHSGHRPVLPGR